MKKILIQLFVFSGLILPACLQAQQIKGRVTDSANQEPLPFANIVIVEDSQSSSGVQGTVTDIDGNFTLPAASQRTIKVSYLGYVTKEVTVDQNIINFITLEADDNVLAEVVVNAARKNFRMENGGISMDVANSPLNNIGTANDVLDKLPFVVKSGDDITVLGKGTPLIYINNRLVRNQQELERLSSNTIKKITVLTNPGPEYDASVSSVILIEAIRQPGEGWGGEVYGRLDARKKMSGDASLDLNYRINNLDVFASYWYNEYRREIDNSIGRSLTSNQHTTEVSGGTIERHNSHSHYLDGGLNYDFNDRHSVGAKYSLSSTPDGKFRFDLPSNVYQDGNLVEETLTRTRMSVKNTSHLLNAYYRGKLASWLKVQFDFDYTTGDNDTKQNSEVQRTPVETVNTNSLQDYDLYAGKLTMTSPVWGNDLKYGLEYSSTDNEQNYIVNQNEGAGELETNTNISKQKILAAFLGYSRSFNKWTISLGARYEHVKFDYYEDGMHVADQSRIYNDLFPTASVDYQGDKVKMSLGYRATTHRPGYNSLRNSIQFDDPYTYETGNPYLKPTKTSDITYSLLWSDLKFIASYKIYSDNMLFVPQQYNDTEILIYRPENVENMQNLSVSAYYSPTFGLWSPTAGLGILKDFLEFGMGETKYTYNKPYFYYSLQNTFKLPGGFVLMADVRGNSRGHMELDYMATNVRVDMSLTKTFMNENLILNLRGSDILGTYRQRLTIAVPPAVSSMDKKLDTRSVVLSVRFKFNTTRSKYKGESASEQERSRL